MIYLVTAICLLLCRTTFSSAIEQPSYQSGNPHRLGSTNEKQISPVFNEIIAPENENEYVPYEAISYKPVTLEEQRNITRKQAHCLKIGNEVKNISRASLWVPLSNSKQHLDNLKVVCNRQQKPKMWFGQSKYQEYNYNQKISSVTYEGADTIVITLEKIRGSLSYALPACNLCLKHDEADSNYINVYIASKNFEKRILVKRHAADISEPETWQNHFENSNSRNHRYKRSASSITLSSSSATKNVGDSLTVTCSSNTKNITWKNAKGKYVESSVNSDPRVKENFGKSQNNSELVFRSISVAMEGNYTCNSPTGSEKFHLRVTPPLVKPKAKITPSKKSVTLDEGSDYTVECSGNSNNVTWRHALYPLPTFPSGNSYYYVLHTPSLNKSTLYFKNITTYFGGEFICSVNISGQQDNEKLVIGVQRASLKFSPDKDTVALKENKDFDISCEGPLKTIAWFYNGAEVSTNKDSEVYQKSAELKEGGFMVRKLKIDDIQKERKGKYVCSGILSFNGSRIERSFTLEVLPDNTLESPKLKINDESISDSNLYYRVNSSLEVVCKGNTDQIEWKGAPYNWKIPENGSPNDPVRVERIKSRKLALKFKSIAIVNEGSYTCEVSKGTVTKTKSFKLNVIDPVRIIGFPQSPTSREGGYVMLGCLTSGHPKAIVNWRFHERHPDGTSHAKLIDGRTNPRYVFDGDNLLINNITYKEAGRYMCEAKQDIEKGNTDMRTIDVTVEHKPYPSRNHTIYEKKLNTVIEIPCKMIANPPAEYAWYQKDADGIYKIIASTGHDPVLKINFSNETQYGDYKCTAGNIIGYNEQYIRLIPMENPRPPKIELDKVTKNLATFKAVAERNSSFIHYNIEYKEKENRDWNDFNVTLGETWDYKYELPNLYQKTTYILRVRSINELGISPPSNEIEFTTALGIRLTVSSTLLFVILLKWFF